MIEPDIKKLTHTEYGPQTFTHGFVNNKAPLFFLTIGKNTATLLDRRLLFLLLATFD